MVEKNGIKKSVAFPLVKLNLSEAGNKLWKDIPVFGFDV